MNKRETMIKPVRQILKDNICTLFNLFNAVIAFFLALAGAWTNLFFILIIALNTVLGIIQELRAKKLVEKLTILSAPRVRVVRNGEADTISVEEIQKGDLLLLESGNQICADAVVQSGEAEVNESILTGESEAVLKRKGDSLLSGSFVISGKCSAEVIHTGSENFAQQLTTEARKISPSRSELMQSMKKVTWFTGFLIVPLGILLFVQAYFFRSAGFDSAVVSTAAGLLGMLPKGLVLLISISLAVGVSRLAKKKVLVQDLFSLETLAHADTICLDKTGTLTEGNMRVKGTLTLGEVKGLPLAELLGSFVHFSDDNNATFQALRRYFKENDSYPPAEKIPFSSQRKWSAMVFPSFGALLIGAPERFTKEALPAPVMEEMGKGTRVLLIGWTDQFTPENPFSQVVLLKAVFLSDPVRANAASTFAAFRREGVDVKVISGDHPAVVSAAARQAGLKGFDSYIDMSSLPPKADLHAISEDYTIFGRATPHQKRDLVRALQEQGRSVAMAGDGVNDILAMREADCSISMEGSSDAARQAAKIVLLNSDFSSLLQVLAEGRRVVNNITKVAGVFFIKTIYSVLLSLLCAAGNMPFPFIPIQITLIDMTIEGYPAFFMSFESDNRKITGAFLPQVLQRAMPNALATVGMVGMILLLSAPLGITPAQASLLAYMIVGVLGMEGVFKACIPFNKLHGFLFCSMLAGFFTALFLFHSLLRLPLPDPGLIPLFIALSAMSVAAERIFHLLCKRIPVSFLHPRREHPDTTKSAL